LFIHALAPSADENRIEELVAWTKGVYGGSKERSVIKADYLAIMDRDGDVKGCFGKEKFEKLRQLKRRVDSENVFKNVSATCADI
jgi:FAD/FMN-containing dehydrogenase